MIRCLKEIAAALREKNVSFASYMPADDPHREESRHVHDCWEFKYYREREIFIFIAPLTVHAQSPSQEDVMHFTFDRADDFFISDNYGTFKTVHLDAGSMSLFRQLSINCLQLLDNLVANLELYEYCRSLIQLFFEALLIVLENVPQKTGETHLNAKVAEMLDFIARRYYRHDLSVSEIAAQVNLCPNYAARIFKKNTGLKLLEFIRSYRLNKSFGLLKSGKYSVKEVACLCGWENQFYFSNCFCKRYKFRPSRLRCGK